MSGQDADEKCPVDHATREQWLAAAKAKKQGKSQQLPDASHSAERPVYLRPYSKYSLDDGGWEWKNQSGRPQKRPKHTQLDTHRETSTIPRATHNNVDQNLNPAERAALPANSEHDTGHDRKSGNWVYPSQEMFFAAMKRKGHDADPADMSSIVPIHNAVNERAWAEIKTWEATHGAEQCGGPKLVSFSGDSKALTPRARWNVLMGYQSPFDRHDWVIDRCGKKIEYVIDFYTGKGGDGLKGLNFYLDVRPKLNTLEGVKMRVLKLFGVG